LFQNNFLFETANTADVEIKDPHLRESIGVGLMWHSLQIPDFRRERMSNFTVKWLYTIHRTCFNNLSEMLSDYTRQYT